MTLPFVMAANPGMVHGKVCDTGKRNHGAARQSYPDIYGILFRR